MSIIKKLSKKARRKLIKQQRKEKCEAIKLKKDTTMWDMLYSIDVWG